MTMIELPTLSDRDIHVWWLGLDVPAETLAPLVDQLSLEERQQAEAFRTDDLRRRFIVRRARLRQLLARYLDTEPATVCFQRGAYGKPALAGPWGRSQLSFSTSHSADLGLVAVTVDRAVGIDAERIRPLSDFEDICRNYFAPSENEILQRLPDSERLAAFFRGWVRKEAMLKALGTGLSLGLDQVIVSLDTETPRAIAIHGDHQSAAAWQLDDLRLAPGFAAALARPAGECRVACFRR